MSKMNETNVRNAMKTHKILKRKTYIEDNNI